MLIVGEEILDLLNDADRCHIKNSSYYLTIGTIIPVGEEAKNFDLNKPPQSLVLRPRHVAWVVSNEVFSIKSHDITALVTLRSTLTKEGLLALDVGMVDPGFEGPIGSIVINFSKNDVVLTKGDEFFRVVFIRHPEVPAEFRSKRDHFTAAEYIRDRYKKIIESFPATFLNTDDLSSEMADKVSLQIKDDILNQTLLYLVKNHWGKFIGVVGSIVIIAVLVVYLLYSNFGPKLSTEDVQGIVKTWIEKNLPKSP
jgi:deoxycytidine triphosphate deaminase